MKEPTINPKLAELYDCLYRISIKAIIFDDGKIYMVRELDDDWWGLPGGGIDYGEDILDALRRELTEELGTSPEDITIRGDIVHATVGGVVDGIPRASLYYRVDIPKDKIKATGHVIEGKWFEPTELRDLVLSPSLTDISEVTAKLL